MFNFFKKKVPKVVYQNFIWIEAQDKYAFLLQALQKLDETGQPVILLSFFEEAHHTLKEKLSGTRLNTQELGKEALLSSSVSLFLGKVSDFEHKLGSLVSFFSDRPLRFIFTEHYPAFEREDTLLQQIFEHFPESEIAFYTALKEPFFEHFGGERIIKFLQTMGISEQEMISHSMVDSAIIKAQKKIQSKLLQESNAKSQKEWIDRNMH